MIFFSYIFSTSRLDAVQTKFQQIIFLGITFVEIKMFRVQNTQKFREIKYMECVGRLYWLKFISIKFYIQNIFILNIW